MDAEKIKIVNSLILDLNQFEGVLETQVDVVKIIKISQKKSIQAIDSKVYQY